MSDDLLPVDIPRPRRKKRSSTKVLERELQDLRQERDGLLERCRIAEQAAAANLGYAQAAREAMEELAARILERLNQRL